MGILPRQPDYGRDTWLLSAQSFAGQRVRYLFAGARFIALAPLTACAAEAIPQWPTRTEPSAQVAPLE